MKISIAFGGPASGKKRDWDTQVEFLREAEQMGVDIIWSAEAWGMDGVSTLAYLAAVTERVQLGTGILQISARTPVMTAMTALSMAAISDDRFILGLGVSGPQVVEGLHGISFRQPLTRLQETVDIVRQAFAGEKIKYEGSHHFLPRPGGEGKALRLSQPANEQIPIWLATLGPKSLEYTGQVADGWAGTSFVPTGAAATIGHVQQGAVAAGRDPLDIDYQAGGAVQFGNDIELLLAPRRSGVAFTLGAMGSATTNFYNDAYSRGGFETEARKVQQLWVEGQREEAIQAVPDELILQTNFLGTTSEVTERVRSYREAGISVLRVQPEGADMQERLDSLGAIVDIVKSLNNDDC